MILIKRSNKIKLLIIIIGSILLLIKKYEITENWIKYEYNPVLGNNKTGSLFDPFIFRHEGLS